MIPAPATASQRPAFAPEAGSLLVEVLVCLFEELGMAASQAEIVDLHLKSPMLMPKVALL